MNEQALLKDLIRIRREIHRFPELGNREFKTAALIESTLKPLKIRSRRITPTGILAEIRQGSGPCLALRADMDALPLTEKSGKPYASKTPGVMHACGHDAHVAMLLGAAKLLSRDKSFSGTVKFLFQPDEEGAGGARAMIEAGAMKNPKVDATFGLHVNPRFPPGALAVKAGPLMAAVDKFEIEILGVGGHAAYPHEGVDAVLVASQAVQAIQAIVSRNLDPVEPAVVTVGTFNSGTRYNILSEKAVLTGTVRTLSEKAHAAIPKLLRRTLEGVTRAHGAKFTLKYETIGSVLSNDKAMSDLARRAAERTPGCTKVVEPENPSMGGEDFAEYLKLSPGCFIYVGSGSSRPGALIPWHHPAFDLDESALPVGSRLLASIAAEFFSQN